MSRRFRAGRFKQLEQQVGDLRAQKASGGDFDRGKLRTQRRKLRRQKRMQRGQPQIQPYPMQETSSQPRIPSTPNRPQAYRPEPGQGSVISQPRPQIQAPTFGPVQSQPSPFAGLGPMERPIYNSQPQQQQSQPQSWGAPSLPQQAQGFGGFGGATGYNGGANYGGQRQFPTAMQSQPQQQQQPGMQVEQWRRY